MAILVVIFGRSVIVAQDLEILLAIFALLLKTTPYGKFSKFFSESFHRLTDRRCCVQIS